MTSDEVQPTDPQRKFIRQEMRDGYGNRPRESAGDGVSFVGRAWISPQQCYRCSVVPRRSAAFQTFLAASNIPVSVSEAAGGPGPIGAAGRACVVGRKWDMGVLSELPQTDQKDRGHVCSGSCKFRHVLLLGGWENEGRINYASGTIKYSAISGGRSVVKFKGGYEMATFRQFAL